jgi:dynein light chain LC8-type
MSYEMETVAFEVALQALNKFSTCGGMAQYMKDEFDRRYGEAWQCIVGTGFGSYVSHRPNRYISFDIGEKRFIVFQSHCA